MKLVKYDAACRAIAAAVLVDEVKEIRNVASAMAAYAHQAKNKQMESDAVAIRMRAERRLGEMIEAQRKIVGMNEGTKGSPVKGARVSDKPTLAEAGIDKNLAHRARTFAAMTPTAFEGLVDQARGAVQRGVERTVVKAAEIAAARQDYNDRAEQGATVGDLHALAAAGKKFAVIYADPPWKFTTYSGKGKQRSAERHYDVMTLADIMKMPVPELAADDCALFLWSVMPGLPGALAVLSAWGFEYTTAGFIWLKQNRGGEGIFTGMGYWTRANAEMCILATKGNPQRLAMDVHQVIVSPVTEHSRKPEEARSRIERLLAGPYLELFGRRAVDGWTVWGNEVQREAAE